MELDPERDLMRFMLFCDDPVMLEYYGTTAIQAIDNDFGQEDSPSAYIKQRATQALDTKDEAWVKFLLLQALAWSPSFQAYTETYTAPAQIPHQRRALERLSRALADFLQGKSSCIHYDHLVMVETNRLFQS
jgi:hypothetical protein